MATDQSIKLSDLKNNTFKKFGNGSGNGDNRSNNRNNNNRDAFKTGQESQYDRNMRDLSSLRQLGPRADEEAEGVANDNSSSSGSRTLDNYSIASYQVERCADGSCDPATGSICKNCELGFALSRGNALGNVRNLATLAVLIHTGKKSFGSGTDVLSVVAESDIYKDCRRSVIKRFTQNDVGLLRHGSTLDEQGKHELEDIINKLLDVLLGQQEMVHSFGVMGSAAQNTH